MTFLGASVLLGIFGFAYLILALQVSGGTPPFYPKGKLEDELQIVVRYGFALILAMGVSILVPHFFFAFGLGSAWIGLLIRKSIRERCANVRHHSRHHLIAWIRRRPMLLFDVWTLGFAAGFVALVLLA